MEGLGLTHVIIESFMSQLSFELASTPSAFMFPFSKSGSTVRLESGLTSGVTGGSSSTSEGSGLIRRERGGRNGSWGVSELTWGLDWDKASSWSDLELIVTLRFWSKLKVPSLGDVASSDGAVVVFWFEFLSKMWFVTSSATGKIKEKYKLLYLCVFVCMHHVVVF